MTETIVYIEYCIQKRQLSKWKVGFSQNAPSVFVEPLDKHNENIARIAELKRLSRRQALEIEIQKWLQWIEVKL